MHISGPTRLTPVLFKSTTYGPYITTRWWWSLKWSPCFLWAVLTPLDPAQCCELVFPKYDFLLCGRLVSQDINICHSISSPNISSYPLLFRHLVVPGTRQTKRGAGTPLAFHQERPGGPRSPHEEHVARRLAEWACRPGDDDVSGAPRGGRQWPSASSFPSAC